MRLTLPGVDGRANAIGFRPPVSAGLTGWWWLGNTKPATEKDHAYIGDGTLAGAPTIEEGYVSFGGYSTSQYLQTEVAETNEFSIMCVVRTEDALASGATLMSWWSSDPGYSGQVTGSLLYYSGSTGAPVGRIRGALSFVSGGTTSSDIDATLVVPDVGEWTFLAYTFNDTSNVSTVYDKTNGLTGTDTNTGTRAPHTTNRLRLGMGHNNNFTGSLDMAWAASYSTPLTSQNVTDTYSFVQGVLADLYSITI
jgi:hypothetical protein